MPQPIPGGPAGAADLVLRNARIATGDERRSFAAALAVKDGRVLAVGDEKAVLAHAGAATRVVDAGGRTAVPGLNDSHLHVIRGGLNFNMELRWDGVPSLAKLHVEVEAAADH